MTPQRESNAEKESRWYPIRLHSSRAVPPVAAAMVSLPSIKFQVTLDLRGRLEKGCQNRNVDEPIRSSSRSVVLVLDVDGWEQDGKDLDCVGRTDVNLLGAAPPKIPLLPFSPDPYVYTTVTL